MINNTLESRQLICAIKGMNFNVTTDQPLIIPQRITSYRIDRIFVTNASISLTTAAGGIYTAISKRGTALVASSQVYSGLSSATVILDLTLTANTSTTVWSTRPLWFSLTTAQGAAATADIYIEGVPLNFT